MFSCETSFLLFLLFLRLLQESISSKMMTRLQNISSIFIVRLRSSKCFFTILGGRTVQHSLTIKYVCLKQSSDCHLDCSFSKQVRELFAINIGHRMTCIALFVNR